jgi:hypothetical protein
VSLSRWERRALRKLEAGISRSDPRLARLLDGFNGLAAGHALFPVERRRRTAAVAWAVSAARIAGRGSAAAAAVICAPGVRERLGVRMRPQPMARAPGQRLT